MPTEKLTRAERKKAIVEYEKGYNEGFDFIEAFGGHKVPKIVGSNDYKDGFRNGWNDRLEDMRV